ncbi:pyridoxal phosphate-dependent aminotransferase [Fictibacillus fluitans]|uniref:Pyridoxal phosphate-dependent aminotransferase n=1 Tax=Fictibacillus fluitans TaxID=3058422 RepID=A0ABT8HSJ3_9BACL|nr:pyridoxal phosphate-dependent aminotransferase [Fictibacillus sp. NE201]MDN4523719.1 pyridoxal phosphate-dependent aminotransferase [Fictibacillus sp. NE201]
MKRFQQADALERLPEQFFAKLVGKVSAVAAQGHDVINLGQGNPDQPTPPHIVSALQEAAVNPQYHKYSPFRGYDFLKEAVADYYKNEFGVEVDPQKEVAVLFGGKAGLVEVAQCFLNKGDTALVPDPGYPDYWSGVAMAEANMSMMPLKEENDFLVDYGQIDSETADRAKLMFLNYPNNPTAGVATPQFFKETVDFAQKHDILVVHDFAYGAIGFDGQKPVSYLEAPGAKEQGIEIYTLSKTYNMAGWRVGFAIGNESVVESINLLQDHFYVSLFPAVQEAAAKALLGPQDCVRELAEMYEKRRNVFISGLQDLGWEVKAPKGSFFCWLPVPKGYTSESFADYLLEEAHVVVAPGIGFGKEGEGYVRVGLLTGEERLKEASDRIRALKIF